jgi:carbonic anhydrase
MVPVSEDGVRRGGEGVGTRTGAGGIDEVLARAARLRGRGLTLAAPPALGLCLVTCMDARIHPFDLLGLGPGDAHIVRTAGALATPAVLQAVAISQAKGGTREVMVVHHTDCVALGLLEAGRDPADTVAEAVARIRAEPSVPHRDAVRGFVLDLATGTLAEATPPA